MKKTFLFLLLLAGSLVCRAGERPKYIFYFIGDGMGHNALALTEACVASERGDSVGFSPLCFTQWPAVGFATTWCATRRTTDSAAAGYTVTRGDRPLKGTRAVLVQEAGADASKLPLAIDRRPGNLSLPAITRRSIDFLMRDGGRRSGFFLMVEGGQIDWAAHDNDAASLVHEVRDFEQAIGVAVDFYRAHPDETLIVVTADHETGGLALGRSNLGYDTYFDLLSAQRSSKGALKDSLAGASEWSEARRVLERRMGFGGAVSLQPKEWEQLEKTYVEHPSRTAGVAVDLLARRAGAGWTTGSHTSAYVPVFAIGVGADRFAGRLDNTEVADRLRRLIEAAR